MNSQKAAVLGRVEQQVALRAQIAALQAQLDPTVDVLAEERKDKGSGKRVLVAGSPTKSPAKKRRVDDGRPSASTSLPSRPLNPALSNRPTKPREPVAAPEATQSRNSNMFDALQKLNTVVPPTRTEPIARSTAFDQPAVVPTTVPARDDNLAVIEDLEPGPIVHRTLPEDPNFERLEPSSGIRLSSRKISHSDLQQHLTGRYFLPPSQLYSIVRLTADKQAYDVPVSGDWITIAVVAERGEVKMTRGGGKADSESENDAPEGQNFPRRKWKEKAKKPEQRKSQGKKFISLKLVDFGNRSSGSATSSTKGGTSRGDALLSLLLFESDVIGGTKADDEEGKKARPMYKGGSGGAFETWASVLREGTVVALLNPRVLRPFQRDVAKPHPTDNILALTPSSADGVIALGQSLDLGRCIARRKDGNQCGGWCDKRINEVCEYHVQRTVQSQRAARPEFAAGTSGMSSVRGASGPDYQKKQGLLPGHRAGPVAAPRDSGGGPTYILEGHVLRSSAGRSAASTAQPEFVNEKLGRERAQRDLRKGKGKKLEEDLTHGLGARADKTKLSVVGNRIGRTSTDHSGDGSSEDAEPPVKSAFGSEAVKKIGFNPAFMGPGGLHKGTARKGKEAADKELHALLDRRDVKTEPKLGAPPGPKVRSGVSVPANLRSASSEPKRKGSQPPSSDLDSDPELGARPLTGAEDSSDLEIEGFDPSVLEGVVRRRNDD